MARDAVVSQADQPLDTSARRSTLEIPPGWVVYDRPAEGSVLVVLEPAAEPGSDVQLVRGGAWFRSNIVVTAVSTGGLGFRDWQVGSDQILARALTDYQLIDLERLLVAGLPGGRRLAHHTGKRGEALTMEQWFTVRDGIGHTLTATVETGRYDELANLTAATAATWRPATVGTATGSGGA